MSRRAVAVTCLLAACVALFVVRLFTSDTLSVGEENEPNSNGEPFEGILMPSQTAISPSSGGAVNATIDTQRNNNSASAVNTSVAKLDMFSNTTNSGSTAPSPPIHIVPPTSDVAPNHTNVEGDTDNSTLMAPENGGSSGGANHTNQTDNTPPSTPLCASNPKPGRWTCNLRPSARPQDPATCLLRPSPVWQPDGCNLEPDPPPATKWQEVCHLMTKKFATITFVGDSLLREVYGQIISLAIDHSRGPSAYRSLCWTPKERVSPVPIAATYLHSDCRRGTGDTGTAKCERPPPDKTCCAPGKTASKRGCLNRYIDAIGCAKHHMTFYTHRDQRFCGGKLQAAFVMVYRWPKHGHKYVQSLIKRRIAQKGRHLLVLGAGLHFLKGSPAKQEATALSFVDGVMSYVRQHDSSGRMTTIVFPNHPRDQRAASVQKYWKSQNNDALRDISKVIVGHLHDRYGPVQGWHGDFGQPETVTAVVNNTVLSARGGETAPAIDSMGRTPGPVHLLDVWRMAEAVFKCPAEQAPNKIDGTHFKLPGGRIIAQLLLNLVHGLD